MFSWEVEKGQHSILILGQRLDRLGIAGAVLFLENGDLLQGPFPIQSADVSG